MLADARREVARIMTEAEGLAGVLSESADQAARQADALADRARSLCNAAAEAAQADEAEAAADALGAERGQLAATVTELNDRITVLGAEREQLAVRMDSARESGDLDGLAALRSRDSAAADIAASLTAQREAALARLDAIGDGSETFSSRPLLKVLPPLAKAVQDAEQHRRGARQGLHLAFPDTPAAIAARAREYELALERAADEQRTAEAARARQAQPRQIVARL